MNKIVIAGGSGYLGSVLAGYFRSRAEVVILSRASHPTKNNIRFVPWDGKHEGPWTKELEGADLLINLSGKNVNCRYSSKNKEEIYQSRLRSTRILGEVLMNCQSPPKVWINSSSATIYVGSYEQLMTEQSGIIGDDFSMDVCKQWEAEFNKFNLRNTRKVIMRTSIVLGNHGGALPALRNLVSVRMGGAQGDGKQYMSWVHEKDICHVVEWLYKNEKATGVYNITAPHPIVNEQFMHHLRGSMHVGWGLPLSRTILEMGAVLIRTETELILKSRKVYPQRLLNEGFVFEFSDPKEALDDLCRQKV